MPQNEVNQYNEVDNDNTDITGTTVVQGQMYPPMVDDAFRKLMGALKRTFRTDLFRLRDNTNQTKQVAFALSGLTTATTRTLTVQNYDGALAANAKSANLASAATTNIWTATGDLIHITGSATITSFGSAPVAGQERTIVFDGSPLLTHNAVSLILPGNANIAVSPGDTIIVRSEGGANSNVILYQQAAVRVVEWGSNANGSYARYSNGVQECWSSNLNDQTTTQATGPLFQTTVGSNWTFPSSFLDADVVVTGTVDSSTRWSSFGSPTASAISYAQIGTINSSAAVNSRARAIGRWF